MARALVQGFIERTPSVVEQVQREVPPRFSQWVLNTVLSGVMRAAKALE